MTSFEIKARLLSYYRFQRNYLVATEVNSILGSVADVMICKNWTVSEIEVKISLSDLKKELTTNTKDFKHNCIRRDAFYFDLCPNKFYFCVPEELKEQTLKFIEELNPKYGLIICYKQDPYIHIFKQAKFLHKSNSDRLKDNMFKRATSELAKMYNEKLGWINHERL